MKQQRTEPMKPLGVSGSATDGGSAVTHPNVRLGEMAAAASSSYMARDNRVGMPVVADAVEQKCGMPVVQDGVEKKAMPAFLKKKIEGEPDGDEK